MRGFGSDNHSGVHPEILQALHSANVDHEPSYGTDSITEKCNVLFKKEFGEQTESFFVFNGTAANVLSLKALMKSHESCFVTDISHMNMDECGAPEFFAGKLIPLKSHNGKFILNELEKNLIRQGDQHFSQPKVISITQPTELGTTYSLTELKEIISWAKKNNLYVHIDGARFTNALNYLRCSMKNLTADLGVDILSFGGTKNGLMFGETVVILNPQLQKDFKYIRKQAAQLPSKTRFIAAQFLAFLQTRLDQKISAHCHQMALYFKDQLEKYCPDITVSYPIQSNAVFARIPKAWVKKLKQHYFFYVWDENTFECRLMCSWDTQKEDIDGFIAVAKQLALEPHDPQP